MSRGVGGCQSWRRPTPDHQIHTGNLTEKWFPSVFCVKMNHLPVDLPADTGARPCPLAGSRCCPETTACLPGCKAGAPCLLRSGCICPHSKFIIHMGGCCVDDGDHSPAWSFNSQSTDPRGSNVLPLPSRGNVSPLDFSAFKHALGRFSSCLAEISPLLAKMFGNSGCMIAFLFLLLESFYRHISTGLFTLNRSVHWRSIFSCRRVIFLILKI